MRVIGLTGRARAGKDTVAQMIFEGSPLTTSVVRHAFADSLKVSAARALGYDGSALQCVAWCDRLKVCGTVTTRIDTGAPFEERTITGREFLQRYGTESHRDVFGQDFWVDAVLPVARRGGCLDADDIRGTRDDCDVLVIPDVRFENEANRIHEYGGEVWRVVRPWLAGGDEHVSETGLPDDLVDRELWNTSTLADLRAVVRAALLGVAA